jgi:Zn-dependent protease with chaperone function
MMMRGGAAFLLAIQLISVSDEIAIGRRAQLEVRSQTRQLADGRVAAYVGRIGRRLAARAPGTRYPYSFSVADYREINAFALPGGPVWVNRGAIASAGDESQLAAVLAHEIAHIALRHSARQLSNTMVANLGLSLLGALLGNSGGANAAGVAARYVASGAFLEFSRDDEREADRAGAAGRSAGIRHRSKSSSRITRRRPIASRCCSGRARAPAGADGTAPNSGPFAPGSSACHRRRARRTRTAAAGVRT